MYAADRAVHGPRARSAPPHAADRGGVLRLRLCAAGAADQPVHHAARALSQFMLLVAIAIILVNALLMIFGPDARNVQRRLPARVASSSGRLIVDAAPSTPPCAASSSAAAPVRVLPLHADRARRSAPAPTTMLGAQVVGLDVKRLYALTFGLGAACVGAAGCAMVPLVDVTPPLGPAYTLLAFVIVIVGGLGSMAGALLGGVLIGVSEALAGLLHRALGEEHVQLRASDPGSAVAPARPARDGAHMTRASWMHAAPRRASLSWRLLLIALPLFAGNYRAFRRDADPLLRLYRPGVERDDGLRRPALARPRPLCRRRRLCGGGAVLPFRHRAWVGLWPSMLVSRGVRRVIGFLAFRFGIAGVYFALLTIAFAEFTRIGFDHFALDRRPGGHVPAVAQRDAWDLAQLPRPAAHVLLRDARADRGRLRRSVCCCCAGAPAITGRRSARTRKPRRRSASTPSAGRCSPSRSARR